MKIFEPFRLDAVNHCLWRDGERVFLTPKAFDVLRYLVDHADRLVSQNEILEALWPETYVNPEGVRKYIQEIRRVLGDRPDQPVFIQTLPKRGYQFVAQVSEERSGAAPSGTTEAVGNIVGRGEALAALDGHLTKALSGHRQVVFVTGEAGIGKTTLLDAFQQRAAGQPNLRIARGQCIEGFGGKEAYYPMLEALGALLQGAQDGDLLQILAKRAPTWLIQFPSLVEAEQRGVVTTRDSGNNPGADGAGDLRGARSHNRPHPADRDPGRSSLGGPFHPGSDLRARPPPRAGKVAFARHLPAGGGDSFAEPTQGAEAGLAGPPIVS